MRIALTMGILVATSFACHGLAAGTSDGSVRQPEPEEMREPITWENVAPRLDDEAAKGFSGAVVLVRDGTVVLEKGYGLADRAAKIPISAQTVFAIGSTPIDFTKAGVLLLAQRGKLKLTDLITNYFKHVPTDKATITLEHLMTGRSGLVDFHDLPTDKNPDHSWIDRDEAIKRIMATKLLFTPGEKNEHSHSAYGVLAAVIEIVSGETYQDFTRRELFKPAGMTDTGFFGDPIPKERMAIGYGRLSGDGPNAPPFWGKTSWLVMGSGGMTSTVVDLRRWFETLESGKLIDHQTVRRYLYRPGALLTGGDMFGFEIVLAPGDGSLMIVLTNATESRRHAEKFKDLAMDLASLVRPPMAPYMIGVQFAIEGDGRVQVETVVPGGASEAAGLLAGDVIVAADGKPIGDEPLARLRPSLNEGKPIEFEVLRKSERLKITVVPRKR